MGEVPAAEVSIVLLQTESPEKLFLATYINASLKKSISVQYDTFFNGFRLLPDSRLFLHFFSNHSSFCVLSHTLTVSLRKSDVLLRVTAG